MFLMLLACDKQEKKDLSSYPTRVEVSEALKQRDAAISDLALGIRRLQEQQKEKQTIDEQHNE